MQQKDFLKWDKNISSTPPYFFNKLGFYLYPLWVFVSLLILASCQTSPPPPQSDQVLHLNVPSDPATLDPRKGGDLISSLFHFLLFDGLVRFDDDGQVAPSLAERIEVSDDKTIYTFYLKDATWSDGMPITAWDFEKSWKDILHPDFPSINAHLLYPIKKAEAAKLGTASLSEVGIESVDAKVLKVSLEYPAPYFLELISFCTFYPVNAEIDHACPEWEQEIGRKFVCSGPFLIKEWKHNNEIVLEKNPLYFAADKIVLEQIKFAIVNSETTSLQMYEKGQIDIMGQPLIALPSDAIPKLIENEELHIQPAPATTFCTFNVDQFPFNNMHIRKAFAYALNRKEIVENITQLNEEPALGIVPPILKKKLSPPLFVDHDIDKARALFAKGLEELGISKGDFPRIKYLYTTSEAHYKMAQALQQQWYVALGIHVDLEGMDRKILLHLLKMRNYQLAQSFWMAYYNDPMSILERFKRRENAKNYPNWENPRYIDLINRSCIADTNEERFALLDEAEALIVEEMPIIPIFHWNSAYIAKPYVKSFGSVPIGNGFYERVYIDQKGAIAHREEQEKLPPAR